MCPDCGKEWSIYNVSCEECNLKKLRQYAPEVVQFVNDATDYQIEGAQNGVVFDGPIPVKKLPLVLKWVQDNDGNDLVI